MQTSQTVFSHALELIERRALRQSEAALRQTIALAEAEDNKLVLGGALCQLGELLMSQRRTLEARPLLERLVAIRRNDNALLFEVDRAQELLGMRAAQ